jgi:predicted phosphoribosyltransferase
MVRRFKDRADAGRTLAAMLTKYAKRRDTLVLGLPRGGVPVAFQIAESLELPLDVFVVRKLGLPMHEEYAMGAIASGGVRFLDASIVKRFGVTPGQIAAITAREQEELARRDREFRGVRAFPDVEGLTIILVDDGLATGATMRAAVQALRLEGPSSIVVAVPVSSRETCEEFRDLVDDTVCALTPDPFQAVGVWYEDFSQTTDEEVRMLLDTHASKAHFFESKV